MPRPKAAEPDATGPQVQTVSIDTLTVDPANLRLHDDRSNQGIEASLTRFGPARSIVLDSKGVVRAGNGTVEAARRAGITDVLIVDPAPGQLVAVRRSDWSPSEATGYGVADNRLTDLSCFDQSALADTLKALGSEDFDLGAIGFTAEEVEELCGGLGGDVESGDDNQADDGTGDDESTPEDGPRIFPDDLVADEAFRHYRKTGFPYRELPLWVCMRQINRLARTDADKLISTVSAYQVPDTYHRHRFHSSAEGMRSPYESYCDDKALRKAIELAIEYNADVEGKLLLVNGTQACSNFRPGFACKLYREYCKPGDTVLDSSTGYGGRLVGFIASGMAGRYIGIDPNTLTHECNTRMATDLGFADRVELHNLPAEDVPHDTVAGRCDFAFTSPPYFRKEHYSDEPTQSWKRYPSGDQWRSGFLAAMMRLQFAALRSGKYAIVNIADVTIKNVVYPLAAWTIEEGKRAGFEYVRTDEFPMQRRFGADNDDEVAVEPVIVFRKPDQTSNGSRATLPDSSKRSTR